ncbi:hypothetical protein AMTR_s00004p00219880 [Amborella trichopoda]|uniref:Uncharacterized protein n=1 Tax=Amborella trichopoda TaxID=13333 RepID=W1NEB2_AMBTC|nr:hypothetical protein AMTR_s00004p00219880 [Amborella trichopoda]
MSFNKLEHCPRPNTRRKIVIRACSGDQAGDLIIGDRLVPIAPHPPSREHSARGSATGSSSVSSNHRADQAPLKASRPSMRVAPNPSVAQFPLGTNQPVVDNPVDPTRIAQAILQAMGNPSVGHATNFLAQPNLGPPQPDHAKFRAIILVLQPSIQGNSSYGTDIPTTAPANSITFALQRLGVDDPGLTEPYDESYLDGFADLPMKFLPEEFPNRFSAKGDPHLHITNYLLLVPAIRDRSVALKAMFAHSLTGDTKFYLRRK